MASSPTTWRRWLAHEMRQLRLSAGLEQKDAAKALRCTVTKVSYIEGGQRSFRPRDLEEILLPLYGVPEEEWHVYLSACKRSKERGWWEEYDQDVVADWVKYYIGLEQGALTIRHFGFVFPHGLIQTTSYATALMRSDPARLTDEEVAGRLEVRERRRAVLDREDQPLALRTIMDESILRRVVGGPRVTREQLVHFAHLAKRPEITIQVLPFSRGPHPDLTVAFTLLSFSWPDDPGVVYLESRSGAEYLEAQEEVEDYSEVFEDLSAMAMSPDESVAMIQAIAEEHT